MNCLLHNSKKLSHVERSRNMTAELQSPFDKLRMTAFLALILFCLTASAQQDEHFTQYMFNKTLMNPAFAGQHESLIRTGMFYRNQWLDFEGAPVTEAIIIDGPIRKKRIGIGLQITNDKIGAISKTGLISSYSYHIRGAKSRLSMGLQGGAFQARINGSMLTTTEDSDNAIPVSNESVWLPDAGFGIVYYYKRLYAGISITHLIESKIKLTDVNRDIVGKLSRHYYFTAGHELELGPTYILYTSLLVKKVDPAPIVVDISINSLIHNAIWSGFSYRLNDAVSLLLGYKINERLRVGYAYDFTITQMSKFSKGTHEIMIGYDMNEIRWPKFCKALDE